MKLLGVSINTLPYTKVSYSHSRILNNHGFINIFKSFRPLKVAKKAPFFICFYYFQLRSCENSGAKAIEGIREERDEGNWNQFASGLKAKFLQVSRTKTDVPQNIKLDQQCKAQTLPFRFASCKLQGIIVIIIITFYAEWRGEEVEEKFANPWKETAKTEPQRGSRRPSQSWRRWAEAEAAVVKPEEEARITSRGTLIRVGRRIMILQVLNESMRNSTMFKRMKGKWGTCFCCRGSRHERHSFADIERQHLR